jgi:lysozyme
MERSQRPGALSAALSLIKRWEGCKLKAYPDPGTGGDPWTIGWGSTGPGISKGVVWTQQQADGRLAEDVGKFMSGVSKRITVPVTDNQLGALTSLAYNIGVGAFSKSTLLIKLNAGDYAGAADQFLAWKKAGGKVMQGLLNRRQDERKVFLTPDDKADFSDVSARIL